VIRLFRRGRRKEKRERSAAGRKGEGGLGRRLLLA